MTGLKLKIGSDDFGSSSIIWYPASGCRSSDGALSIVDYNGFYWSVTPYSGNAYYLRFSYDGDVDSADNYSRSYGFSVRCLQESE